MQVFRFSQRLHLRRNHLGSFAMQNVAASHQFANADRPRLLVEEISNKNRRACQVCPALQIPQSSDSLAKGSRPFRNILGSLLVTELTVSAPNENLERRRDPFHLKSFLTVHCGKPSVSLKTRFLFKQATCLEIPHQCTSIHSDFQLLSRQPLDNYTKMLMERLAQQSGLLGQKLKKLSMEEIEEQPDQ